MLLYLILAQDEHYSWNYTGKYEKGVGWDAYLINMTSQMWLNETFVDRPIWFVCSCSFFDYKLFTTTIRWHWLWIVVPKSIKHHDFATVVGTGGDNRHYDVDDAPSREDIFFIACQNIARDTGSICAALYQIPNQPLTFYNDPLHTSRSEDGIKKSKYIRTSSNRYVHSNNRIRLGAVFEV